MPETRRKFIQKTIGITCYFASVSSALFYAAIAKAAWPAAHFKETQYNDSLQQLFGHQEFTNTDQIKLKLPRIAENGAVVPITITSNLKTIETVSILVEKNPVPLVAQFTLTEASAAYVSARIKMAETSDVIVIAKAGNNYYSTRQMVKVTIGGCGG